MSIEGYQYIWSEEFPGIPEDIVNDEQRDVLYLHFVADVDYEEIAELTGRAQQNVLRSFISGLERVENFILIRNFLKKLQ